MTAQIIPFPVSDHPWRGAYGFGPVESVARLAVDVEGGRVYLGGDLYTARTSETSAIRIAAALQVLIDHDALPGGRP